MGFNKSNGSRILFYGQIEHDDFEKKKLAEFQHFLQTKVNNNYDQTYFTPQKLLLFHAANGYKNEQTYESMKKHLEFAAQYIRNADGLRIIQYEKDEKVKSLVVNTLLFRIQDFSMSVAEIAASGPLSSSTLNELT